MELTGILSVKYDTMQVSESFKKREFVLQVINERNREYDDFIKIQLTQDKCAIIEDCNLGDELKCSINIRGRKWEKDGKVSYFNTIESWRIEKLGSQSQQPNHQFNEEPPSGDDVDELPF